MTRHRLRRRPDVLWRRSLDAVVLLPSGADDVVTLAGTGPALWELLAEWRTVDDLVATLAAAFGAPEGQVATDLAPLLEELTTVSAIEAATNSGSLRSE